MKKKVDKISIAFIFFIFFLMAEKTFSTMEKHFPLLNLIASSPAFQKQETKFTSNEEVYNTLKKLSEKSLHVSYFETELKKIPYVLISENKKYSPQKSTIWIQAMQHGDEHGSGEAALGLAEYFSLNVGGHLEKMNVIVFPRLNMYGAEKNNNRLAGGIDMNTDHILLSASETKDIKKEIMRYNPEVILDLHEYPASEEAFSKFSKNKILPYYDILISPPTNKNISEVIKNRQKNQVQEIKKHLEKNEVRIGSYYNGVKENAEGITLQVPSASIKIARNAFALIPAFSFLVEGRGKDLGLKLFQRRVGSIEDTVVAFINLYKGQSPEMKRYLAEEREKIMENKDMKIILSTGGEVYRDDFIFIDTENENVKNYRVNMQADFSNDIEVIREQPAGYIVNSEEKSIIEKLQSHGIKFTQLMENTEYTIEEYKKGEDRKSYILKRKQKNIPSGSIIVRLNQMQNILIGLLFEPESETSFINLNLVSRREEYLPYSRIVEK